MYALLLLTSFKGARITFGFMNCPLCKKLIEHESLKKLLKPLIKLKSTVEVRISFIKENNFNVRLCVLND